MTPRQGRIALIAGALIAAAAGFGLAHELDRKPPELASGTWLPAPRSVGDHFVLTDTRGHRFTVQQLYGHPSLVFFGFTHCPDVCPITLSQLAVARKAAGIAPLKVLFVTIDPQRDTPERLEQYVHAFDPQFIGLTPDALTLAHLARTWGVAVNRVPLPGGDYTMDHSAVVFLLDSSARIVGMFTPPFDPRRMAADLKGVASYIEASD